jgi:hypothetical protein
MARILSGRDLTSFNALMNLCGIQGLDARNIIFNGLSRHPEINRALCIQPELRRIAEQAGKP